MKKSLKDLDHIFPYGATTISFSRIYSSDKTPCKISTTMPFEKFPVDPSDYRTDEHKCPEDMVATGIILDEDHETTTLVCSPVYHTDQLDNNKCQTIRVPYSANPKADWDHYFPYEANGKCPHGYMLTGVDYYFDQPYIQIKCCARKDIDQIISAREKYIRFLIMFGLLVVILFFFLYRKKQQNDRPV